MKKWIKLTAYAGLTFIVLVLLLAAFTQTRTFKNWLRDQIEQQANAQLNGTLQIGRIDGNLINDFMLSRLLLQTDQDTLAFLPKLTIRLQPGKLLDNIISLRVVALDSPFVKLWQRSDSLWNVATLTKESDSTTNDSAPFAWQVTLEKAALSSADIRISPLMNVPVLPRRVHNLHAQLSANYQRDSLRVQLEKLAFRADKPDFELHQLGFNSNYADSILKLENIRVALQDSRIDAAVTLQFTASPNYRFEFKATPLDLDGLNQLVPDFGVAGKPNFVLNGHYLNDSLNFNLSLAEQQSTITTKGSVANLAGTPRFALDGTFSKLQLAKWYPPLDSLQLQEFSGSFVFSGSGNSTETVVADVQFELLNIRYRDMLFDHVQWTSRYQQGDATTKVTGQSAFGKMTFSGTFKDVLRSQQFQMAGAVEHADVGKALAVDSLRTDINLSFRAQGRGFDPDTATADIVLELAPSDLAGLQLDTLYFSARIEQRNFAIDTLQIESALGDFYAAGSASLSKESDLRFRGKLGDMRWVAARVGADTLRVNGELDGKISGKFQALRASLKYRLADVSYNTIHIDSLVGTAAARFSADSLEGSLVARLKKSRLADVAIDSLTLQSDFTRQEADVALFVRKDADLSASTKSHIVIDTTLQISFADLAIQFKKQHWKAPSNRAKIIIADSAIVIEALALSYRDQRIDLAGSLRPDREQALQLRIENLDLPTMIQLLDSTITGVKGRLKMTADLTGTLTSPNISAKMLVENGTLTKVKFDSLSATIAYANTRLSWLYQLYWQQNLTLRGDGYLPIDLMAPDSVEILAMDKPFRFQVASSGIDLSFLQSFTKDVKNLNGLFVCDVRVENTLRNPEPVGHLSIFDGTLSAPEFGMNYRDIQVRLLIDKESIRVTEFDVGTETKVVRRFLRRRAEAEQKRQDMRGRLWIEPGSYIDFDSTGFLAGVDSMSMKVRANQFLLANNSDYQAQINADVNIYGNVSKPRFDGSVTVLRSSLYLPALESTGIYDEERIQSLLKGVAEDTAAVEPEVVESGTSDYFSNLRGSLKIEIPKNAWVRGSDMNIELAGTLDLVKDGPEFEQPFGTIQVVRGTYDLFNAYKFDIEDGNLFFEGGQEFNPNMDIQAKHTIRTQNREIHDLKLHVTNRMFSPEMKFFLDDEPVETTEALRFLVTGGYGKGGNAQSGGLFASNGGKEATGLLAGMLTSQLSRFLLNNQVLDVLEVKGDLTGEQASIVLGKYITNKLFLSLEKAINLGNSNEEGISDEITVEYALTRYLILQAIAGDERTTGFDVFWKFSK